MIEDIDRREIYERTKIRFYIFNIYKAIETESTEGSEVERSDNSFTSSHEISRQAGRRGRRVL